ncbi:basic-leucine zipper transcription factor A-like [Drosophila mojavensis]|uniref:basic-leucine zipper transcription factor A-like n=1 Tax=Drosophila mojavensis TaxID=7230 RepID=UPI001CD13983|nr:basic-leucine zipper transcription factor A-like [Drosophila mojavensis]
MATHKAIIDVLAAENVQMHTHQSRNQRGYRVVIKKLHHSIPCDWLRAKLSELGFVVRFVRTMKHRFTGTPLNVFEVELQTMPDGSHLKICDLDMISNQMVQQPQPVRQTTRQQQQHQKQLTLTRQPKLQQQQQQHQSRQQQSTNKKTPLNPGTKRKLTYSSVVRGSHNATQHQQQEQLRQRQTRRQKHQQQSQTPTTKPTSHTANTNTQRYSINNKAKQLPTTTIISNGRNPAARHLARLQQQLKDEQARSSSLEKLLDQNKAMFERLEKQMEQIMMIVTSLLMKNKQQIQITSTGETIQRIPQRTPERDEVVPRELMDLSAGYEAAPAMMSPSWRTSSTTSSITTPTSVAVY